MRKEVVEYRLGFTAPDVVIDIEGADQQRTMNNTSYYSLD